MSRFRSLATAAAVLSMLLPGAARAQEPTIRAGVGITDATWHVGVGSGQYTAKDPNALSLVTGGEIDPHNHANTQRRSYGVQSRLTYRALVVEGTNGERIALVKTDGYLASDLLSRRVAQLLAGGDSGIGYDQIMQMASHNHSSPYYMSPAWGVWLFQDVFEARVFEYHARQMAAAIELAADNLVPARMGATVVRHTIYKGMIARQGVADDGTPRGYPETTAAGTGGHGDFGVTILRFDDISGPRPVPLAAWVNHGQHPESLDGYDLITADYLAPLERMIERETGAHLIFSQGDVGSGEGPTPSGSPRFATNQVLPDGVRRVWAHVGHAQTERGARYLADSIIQGWNEIGDGEGIVPFSSDFPVKSVSRFFPGPVSHPYPSVSNCRSEPTVEGNPGSPIVGLPDCERLQSSNDNASLVYETMKAEGIPVPDHYDAPGFAAVEENLRLRLQAFRLGEVVLASCACEAQNDLILNFESRADDQPGVFDGYDYEDAGLCSQNPNTTWTCSSPSTTFSHDRYLRMKAQIHNDADGWDLPENAIAANSEPANPDDIWGNFTKRELGPDLGYALPVGVGHATEYNGYTVSYREYMSYDHYRKALTSYGPHTADYMSTRMVGLAAELNGAAPLPPEPLEAVAIADEVRQVAFTTALGTFTGAVYDAWLAALPDDIGPAEALAQPAPTVKRFDAATFTWRGGSNAVDNPVVRVERLDGDLWVPYADMSGEVQTKVNFPSGLQGVVDTYSGSQEWLWTANFEAFDAFPARVVDGGQVPNGTYRFVAEGLIRQGGVNDPYTIVSDAFEVVPWDGIVVTGTTVDGAEITIEVDITYPRSYTSSFRYIADDANPFLCRTCSFRPWASTSDLASAWITVVKPDSTVHRYEATVGGTTATAVVPFAPGDSVYIAPGDLVDAFGETNAAAFGIA